MSPAGDVDAVDEVAHVPRPALPRAVDAPPSRQSVRRLPGDAGFWFFLAGDAMLFALLFLQFSIDRSGSPALFDVGRAGLLLPLGAANTIVLVTSSWLVALATGALGRGEPRRASTLLLGTVGLAAVFAAVKAVEYAHAVGYAGRDHSSSFFTYYFVITGIHLLHVVLGAGALGLVARLLRRGRGGPRLQVYVESAASYWHLVDMLWLFVFPLLYLAR